ncbi:uncharacterized protein LOC122017463 [Zingiber officinale]|uniref:Myb-like domain-containing protein n=1 Tax=Zingiber officinale TaxID=94328 RepID=A0A8J5M7J1_ZINOF|nr:uncharacterized protein LOC122017463 [Zingiber officinale]KAG6535487.1 hypothetical protein ZIOFF_000487 [Zingiber officinale]
MGARVNADGTNGGPLPAGSGGGGSSALRNSTDGTAAAAQALKHNPGLSIEWSAEEQATLEEGLSKYASETILICYAKIAMKLHDKTVRDVAMRCRWMTKKENSKRRKEEHNLARKSKDKKERVSDASAKALSYIGTRPNVPTYPPPMLPVDDDDIAYKDIGGRTGELLESNAEAFSKISANFTNLKIQDNINLFCQTLDNILSVLKDLTDMPEIMKQMPSLPVKLNEELAKSILPRPNM